MAINASIITDTAKEATKRAVVDYGAGVFAHTTQDWARHNVLKVYPGIPCVVSSETIATQTLRLVATRDDGSIDGVDIALAVPINPTGTSAITNSPPIIIQQPTDKVVAPSGWAQFVMAAISDLQLSFQWQKLSEDSVWEDLSGKTATTLVVPVVEDTDEGSYRVIVTNANGSTTSDTVTLTTSTGGGGSDGDDPFYESLPGVKLFRSIF